MNAFFKSFHPTLEDQLKIPSFEKTREEVWQQLHDWNLPVDYSYFLVHAAGKTPKGPSFDLAIAIPNYESYQQHIAVQEFLSWRAIENWYLEQKTSVFDLQYCPIATMQGRGQLTIGLNKVTALAGGIFYQSKDFGVVKLANNLLEFLQKSIKRTPWSKAMLLNIAQSNAIEQGQVKLSAFEDYPVSKYHKEMVLLQQYQGAVEYLITRSSIVLFGEETREYWLEELKEVKVDKVAYMQLAINKIQQLQMTLDFGHIQEEITLYNIQEQRAIQKLLGFVINNSRR